MATTIRSKELHHLSLWVTRYETESVSRIIREAIQHYEDANQFEGTEWKGHEVSQKYEICKAIDEIEAVCEDIHRICETKPGGW